MGRLIQNMGGGGGGVSSDEVTAKQEDVLKGKTAVTSDSNDEAGMGTLELMGNAAAGNVKKGETFYTTDPKSKQTGTLEEKTGQYAATSSLDTGNKRVRLDVPGRAIYGDSALLYDSYANIASRIGLTAAKLAQGQSVLGVTGTYKGRGNAAQANVEAGKTFSTASLDNASGSMAVMGGQTITPSKSQQTISCAGKKMSSNIIINAIPGNYYDLTGNGVVFKEGVWGPLATQNNKIIAGYYSITGAGVIIMNNTSPDNMFWGIGSLDNYKGILCELKTTNATKAGYRLERSIDLTPFKSIKIGWRCGRDWSSSAQTTRIQICLMRQNKKEIILQNGTPMAGSRYIQYYFETDITDINEYAFFSFNGSRNTGSNASHLITSVEFIKK